jgi:hypothetical protein
VFLFLCLFCPAAQQSGLGNPFLFFIVIPTLGGISVGFAGMMDYWIIGKLENWVNGLLG